ncbi:sulfurtransferase [Pseudorhodobacter sp. MZDSW-24AT]|uniref:sulfurtransferase n=1 Tax=Pseudorhodobacter sp. MZDSW-24AT TaxID=2052957 RepID=UPI001E3FC159|nr:rhodanese-like domain-containing protein [Pseudorhodobacter sp. MZDSW-24AT]
MPVMPTRRAFLATSFLMAVAPMLLNTPVLAHESDPSGWLIEAKTAHGLLEKGALLLDTRAEALRNAPPLPGAIPVTWQEFSHPDLPEKGHLLKDDAVLTAKLRALGVSAAVPVIVVADPAQSWGEDGRIVWTLRALGHRQTYLVNGGVAALLAEGELPERSAVGPGDFTVTRTPAFEIEKEELAALIGQPDVVILDTREPREFSGATPYGETRGGHVPGAKHVYFKDLIGADGRALEGAALQARLDSLGITAQTQVVSYCTAGIRSGLVTAILQSAGVNARNYAGSMWEWSAADPATYPLVTE